MLKTSLIATAATVGLALSLPASAHNALDLKEAFAGYSTPMVLSVNHGCKTSPVAGLRIKVPDGITDAKAAFDASWTIEYKMRKLAKPLEAHGRQVTEVVDEIVWKNPVKALSADGWYPFRFRMTMPETPNKVLHIKAITVCTEGTDAYVDMPKQELKVDDPEFAKKAWEFMTATPTPAPFLVIRAPDKKQYPWEWTSQQARGGMSK
jgi:periplasmic copper chaperone A